MNQCVVTFDDDLLTDDDWLPDEVVEVGVSLKVEDNEKKNVIFPITPITGAFIPGFIKVVPFSF